MKPRRAGRVCLLAALACAPVPLACSTPTSTGPGPMANRPTPSASASASAHPPELKGPEYTENDFVESDRNRDPFHSFMIQTAPTERPAENQRHVELADFSVDELKLVAIVQGADKPRAMFLDPRGKGTIVYRGTFLCRPDVVHVGGPAGHEYEINWRVDRIRDGDVVLIREDGAHPEIPAATRVIPLHPEADKEAKLVPG
jgi:type IV pilus assembly protein PilP